MKLLSVINKSFKEQIRHFWILILTISMSPFFVLVYFLINQTMKPSYDLLVLNQDKGWVLPAGKVNYGTLFIDEAAKILKNMPQIPITIKTVNEKSVAMERIKNRKAEALVIFPNDFSRRVADLSVDKDAVKLSVEIVGDLTNINYMVSAVWTNEFLQEYVANVTARPRPLKINETSLGISGNVNDFALSIPGLLILGVIMLMFSATIAIVAEVENKTVNRLKLSKVSALEFVSGVSLVQVVIGIVTVLITLAVAVALGFDNTYSFGILIFVVILTGISIIAFSLILAAVTKTVNEVLIVGNFPLFLFMFFTGAAFPMKGKALLTIAGYPLTVHGLMSPTHAISALNKVMIMQMGFVEILPEIIVLVLLTIVYFIIGVWAFQRRHMAVE